VAAVVTEPGIPCGSSAECEAGCCYTKAKLMLDSDNYGVGGAKEGTGECITFRNKFSFKKKNVSDDANLL
jgi:hypothetical protein